MSTGIESHQPEDSETAGVHDPRPVFEGDWQEASPQARGAHGQAVKAWKARQAVSEALRSGDPDVAAILGSAARSAPLTPDASLGLDTLRDIARDPAAPASARVTAASALRAHDLDAQRTAQEEERGRVTAALASAPLPERLMLLERIVRRDEPEGWVSVFAGTTQGQTPAEAARAAAEE